MVCNYCWYSFLCLRMIFGTHVYRLHNARVLCFVIVASYATFDVYFNTVLLLQQ